MANGARRRSSPCCTTCLISVGVYSVFRFEVTPATVVAFLTILGFSLYDTIVVFDKVNENTERFSGARVPYADMINVSMNQVLMRSINTSLAAVLPVLSLLVLGAGIIGAVALREFSLALLVGLITGSYSSIFVARRCWRCSRSANRGTATCAAPHATGAELERSGPGRLPGGPTRRGPRAIAASPAAARVLSRPPTHEHAGVGAHPPAAAAEEEASHQLRDGSVKLYGIERPLAQPNSSATSTTSRRRASASATSRRCSVTARGSLGRSTSWPTGSTAFRSIACSGIEARGFIIAAPVAYRMGAGFVPVRKAGKLPWAVVREEYSLEYGTDKLEIHRDAIHPGERILVIDDVLATGGTAAATVPAGRGARRRGRRRRVPDRNRRPRRSRPARGHRVESLARY